MCIAPKFALNVTLPLVLFACMSLIGGGALADDKTEAATAAALEWLARLDSGAYGESWDLTAPLFQSHVTRDQWIRTAAAVREPLGDLQRRELAGAEYTTTLPGAPDGEYVVLKFSASFANKRTAQETVTPMFADGTWRVSGYFVR